MRVLWWSLAGWAVGATVLALMLGRVPRGPKPPVCACRRHRIPGGHVIAGGMWHEAQRCFPVREAVLS